MDINWAETLQRHTYLQPYDIDVYSYIVGLLKEATELGIIDIADDGGLLVVAKDDHDTTVLKGVAIKEAAFSIYDQFYIKELAFSVHMCKSRRQVNDITDLPESDVYPNNIVKAITGEWPLQYADTKGIQERVDYVMSYLTIDEAEFILELYKNKKTRLQIATELNTTRDKIWQFELKILKKIRSSNLLDVLCYGVNAHKIFENEAQRKPAEERSKDEDDRIIALTIEELELKVKPSLALKNANVNTVGDLIMYSKSDLSKIQGLSRAGLAEIAHKLSMLGLSLMPSDGKPNKQPDDSQENT